MSVPPPKTISIVFLLQAGYLSASALILIVWAIPVFRRRFLEYGARASSGEPVEGAASDQASKKSHEANKELSPVSLFVKALDVAAKVQVPHSWFTSFYVVSVLCSLFWLVEVFRVGDFYGLIVENRIAHQRSQMSLSQTKLAWLLMLIQGSRRLYESLTLPSSSTSRMWIGHWVIGIGFYVATGVAIWVEGAVTLLAIDGTFRDLVPSAPSLRTFIALPMFMLASGLQHDVHTYLASLKKSSSTSSSSPSSKTQYSLPVHAAFGLSLTPHYFAECVIYLSLSILTAPSGSWLNGTVFCAFIFTAVNLGVTADGTREWYRKRFGAEKIGNAARMIPGIW